MADAPTLSLRFAERLVELQGTITPEQALSRTRSELADAGEFPLPAHTSPNLWRGASQDAVLSRVRQDLLVPTLGAPGEDPGFSPSSHPLRRVLPFVAAHAVARQFGASLGEASAVAPLIVQAGVALSQLSHRPTLQQPEAEQRSTYAHLARRAEVLAQAQAREQAQALEQAPPRS